MLAPFKPKGGEPSPDDMRPPTWGPGIGHMVGGMDK